MDYINKADLLLALAELPNDASKREMLQVVYDAPVGIEIMSPEGIECPNATGEPGKPGVARDTACWMVKTDWDEKICDYKSVKPGDPFEDAGRAFCSTCGDDALENVIEDYVWSRFCPHCGAKMVNWQSDEERESAYHKIFSQED